MNANRTRAQSTKHDAANLSGRHIAFLVFALMLMAAAYLVGAV